MSTKAELIARIAELEAINAAQAQRIEAAVVAYKALRAQLPRPKLAKMVEVGVYADKAALLAALGNKVAKHIITQRDGKLVASLRSWE
jgi:hypothetical protein